MQEPVGAISSNDIHFPYQLVLNGFSVMHCFSRLEYMKNDLESQSDIIPNHGIGFFRSWNRCPLQRINFGMKGCSE